MGDSTTQHIQKGTIVYAQVNPEKLVRWQNERKNKYFLVSLRPFKNSITDFLHFYPESEYESRLVRGYALKQGEKYDRNYGFDQETLEVIQDLALYAVVTEKP